MSSIRPTFLDIDARARERIDASQAERAPGLQGPAHAALHEELGEILFAAAAAHDDVAAAAAQQLRDHLAAAVTGPPEAQKQALYAEFCASGPRDLPTYNLALARFAHDLACFRAACS